MMKKTIAALAFSLLMSASSFAGTLKVGHSTWVGYGPFYIALEKGFFKEEGVDVEFVIMEDTAIKIGALFADQIDIAASTSDEFPSYLKPGKTVRYFMAVDYSNGGDGIVASKSIKTVADLKGKKLGLGQGTNYADMAKKVGDIDIKTYPGAQEYLQDLALGRIDAALNDSLLIPYIVKQTKLPLKPGAPVGELEKSGIPFTKNNPKFKAALDKALAALKADGGFAKISAKWFDRDVSKPPVAVK